jgi:alpha-beta hydrolase superfamily lysophospholipase
MPGKALSLVYDGNRRIEEIVGSITCPALAIHALHDTLAHWQSAPLSLARIPHSRKETLIIENGRHSIFASGDDKQKVFSTISNFLERSFASKSYDA